MLRDPDAAMFLIQQLSQQPTIPAVAYATYNPTRLYAQAALAAGWLPSQCDEQHYVTFFAVVREMGAIRKEEQDDLDHRTRPLPSFDDFHR
jgi:hypothetical protein